MLLRSVIAFMTATPGLAQTRIDVYPDEIIAHVSRTMTGACIEDVNHELYGGIYTQMVFGESFQEPPLSEPPDGFAAYDGLWEVGQDGVLSAEAGPGPKLVRSEEGWGDGAAGVEVLFDESMPGNAGLILRVREAGPGADAFVGYEVSLDQARGVIVIGRHENNWQPMVEAAAEIPVGRWVALDVQLSGGQISVGVDGRHAAACTDPRPLPPGAVGLRPWQRRARFRDLWTDGGRGRQDIPFVARESGGVRGAVSRMWRPVCVGQAEGSAALTTERPFVGDQSQTLTMAGGPGSIGVENRGLNRWGMCFRRGRRYEGCLWARSPDVTPLRVALESADGARIYAESVVTAATGDWGRADFTLIPDDDAQAGRLAIYLTKPGSVTLGYVALHPGKWGRYGGLASRRDVVEGLVEEGLTVLRCGGSMVNTDAYRWQKMIGPRDRREPYSGTWYPWSSNGWGIIDLMQLCDAAGFVCIPAFNMGETPQSMADFVAYANAPRESDWGVRRVADGHPEPYHLRYIELGNEEAVDEDYWRRFKPLAEAIWAADSEVTVIVGDFAYNEPIRDPLNFSGAPRITSLAAHRKILQLAAAHGREVWFDVHVWSEHPATLGGLYTLPSLVDALHGLCPEARFKLCVLELNANRHDLSRALANARSINALERMGDRVPVVCSANCLQPDGQNDNGWDQGLLFLNPSKVWPQPPYFVMQMLSRHWLPLCVRADVAGGPGTLDVAAKRSEDGRTLQLQVVNFGDVDVPVAVDVHGFRGASGTASAEVLSGAPDAVNTASQPGLVAPRREQVKLPPDAESLSHTFSAHSFTILRLR
jgi:Alpha-L-arabinofuranosidase C-terminal domain/3-keto-disaccharide hydrolase/Alpha-L-arabinofuranosidase 1 domain